MDDRYTFRENMLLAWVTRPFQIEATLSAYAAMHGRWFVMLVR